MKSSGVRLCILLHSYMSADIFVQGREKAATWEASSDSAAKIFNPLASRSCIGSRKIGIFMAFFLKWFNWTRCPFADNKKKDLQVNDLNYRLCALKIYALWWILIQLLLYKRGLICIERRTLSREICFVCDVVLNITIIIKYIMHYRLALCKRHSLSQPRASLSQLYSQTHILYSNTLTHTRSQHAL